MRKYTLAPRRFLNERGEMEAVTKVFLGNLDTVVASSLEEARAHFEARVISVIDRPMADFEISDTIVMPKGERSFAPLIPDPALDWDSVDPKIRGRIAVEYIDGKPSGRLLSSTGYGSDPEAVFTLPPPRKK